MPQAQTRKIKLKELKKSTKTNINIYTNHTK